LGRCHLVKNLSQTGIVTPLISYFKADNEICHYFADDGSKHALTSEWKYNTFIRLYRGRKPETSLTPTTCEVWRKVAHAGSRTKITNAPPLSQRDKMACRPPCAA
jgi:hypothetical protein